MRYNLDLKKVFPKSKSVGKRSWGKEDLLVLIPKVLTLKKILIKKGKMGGLQYHRKKNECGILISGKLKIKFVNSKNKLISKVLKKGDTFHFPPNFIHQEIAITNCTIIEASTPHFNDRMRVEKRFKVKNFAGLPSTKLKDIVFR